MTRLFHSAARGKSAKTATDLVLAVERRLKRARLFYGHGTDNARDEAAALVYHAMELSHDDPRAPTRRATAAQLGTVETLTAARIERRVPLAYLTHEAWFAGLPFYVDERVLVPRSPIAELIERQFAPWIDARRVKDIVDIGTGSGCIALACAKAFPRARVDAVDIDPAALEVAAINRRRLRLTRRVRLVESDHFTALSRRSYDIIVSNPPYVGAREMRGLPREYRHEPQIALQSGSDGLDSVATILRAAGRHLRPLGLLVVEVGNTERLLARAYPKVPFTWLEFERGGGGVFVLTREQLDVR
jgi:ribosomal protein L3 glutamine methyltransferase